MYPTGKSSVTPSFSSDREPSAASRSGEAVLGVNPEAYSFRINEDVLCVESWVSI